MVDVVLVIAVITLISIFLILIALLRPKLTSEKAPDVSAENQEAQPRVAAVRQNLDQDAARFIRARRSRGRHLRHHVEEDENDVDEDEEEDPLAEHIALPEGKIGVKKRKKLEMKAEKKMQRERDEEEREERKQRALLLEEQRKKEEEREKAEQAKQEEEEKLRKEELARKEHEEYLLLKESFSVEDSGFDQMQSENETQDLLKQFIDHIKKNKVVLMEDLAATFKLKTQEAIERLQSLQKSGQLSGVIDDRGKFIYVSREELESVSKFIRQRGRVSIAELVEASNTLINLTGGGS
uniref:DDRGK domain-containing protein 1 n=1 Tax=Strigamia maritima TaxID=126957 RepID=T1IMN2_STRMM